MNLKKRWSVLLCSALSLTLFASPTLAASAPVTNEQKSEALERSIVLGQDEFTSRVLSSVEAMSPYITVDEDGVYHIDPAAKDVVEADIYEHYAKGVQNLNSLRQSGSSTSGPQITPFVFSNTFWWGVAITFDDAETKRMVYSLQQTANVGTLLAGIAAFIPVAWLGSVVALIEATGANMIATSMNYHNKGNGVTLNLHWLPVPYFESTPNG